MNEWPSPDIKSGKAAAAIMAVGIGALALGIFTLAGDAFAAAGAFFTFWPPTGPLSGVTDLAIAVWLVAWLTLWRLWRGQNVNLGPVNIAAAVMIAAGLLLTFPPVMDLLQGK